MIRLAGALFAVAVFASPLVEAQNSLIRGELRGAPGAGDQFSVTLISGAGPPETAYVGAGGSIQFHSIPQGTYQMEVRNMHGEVVKQQMLTVVGPSMETIITLTSALRAPRAASPSDGATVSLNRLRHDPDGKAEREFKIGSDLLLKKDLASARKHLVKALKADPDFADAHLELGTTAYRMGEIDTAKQEFEQALKLDPKLTIAWSNLASLLFHQKAHDEAEIAARHGLEAVPTDAKLHFVAGASQFAKGTLNQDTTHHLELATKLYPNAHLLLAETLMRLGQAKSVLMHLEAALISGNEEVRTRAQYLIGRINSLGLRGSGK